MTSSIKPILFTACISYALLISQSTFAKEHHKRDSHGPLQSLSLTEEQQAKIDKIGLAPAKHKRKKNPLKLYAPIVFASELDEQQLALAIEADVATKKHFGLASAKRKHAIYTILTDEQKQQLAAQKLDKLNDHAEKRSLEEKLTKRLALTEAQLASIQTQLAALDTLREAAHEQRQTFKEFEKTLLNEETFNTEAWLTQFNITAALMKTNATAFATNMHQIYLSLDEQQQFKIKRGLMKNKKNKHKKHD